MGKKKKRIAEKELKNIAGGLSTEEVSSEESRVSSTPCQN
tara:strand:- start:2087 stop:2206 length:120 start_codon:yes stop_codon:yes gene_type:complete